MRLSAILFGLILMCAAIAVAVPPLQDEGDVRGAFLTSRPKEKKPASSAPATRPKRKRPVASSNTSAKSTDKTSDKTTGSSAGSKLNTPESRPVNVPRIGLGLTLFSRDSNGLAVRVEPD
ncbi:MAG TPA: hypothetical protein VHH35_04605, partial [Pyrinomonadaceae bacterium]|nr:hypothetical protein [Pyrinomonadaceae bacterium]